MVSKDEMLHEMSLELQQCSRCVIDFYNKEGITQEEINAMADVEKEIEIWREKTSEFRTAQFELSQDAFEKHRQKVAEVQDDLENVVEGINTVNELIHIATQVAQIAAGLMV